MKGRKKLPLFLLLISLFQITISVESHATSPALLKYVLEWPPTFCIQLNLEQQSRCKEPIPQHEFTLHGLMPADEEGYSIKNCDHGKDPNWVDLFGPIKDELITFWPSLREDFNETEFWKHEWRTHGSCGGTTPEEYFHKAIEINNLPEHGNLFNYFEASGLIPSDDLAYPKQHVLEAIQKLFDEFPSLIHDTKSLRRRSLPPPPSPPRNIYLSCIPINPENTTHVYLSEVTLCTNLDGNGYISCPSKAEPTSCPDEALIMLPLPKDQKLDLPLDIWKTSMARISDVWYHRLNKIFNG